MRTLASISLLALVISATDASAACKQAALAGNWHYFASNVVLKQDGSPDFTFLEDCTFRIDASGVVSNSRCIVGETDTPFGDPTSFHVNPDCSITTEQSSNCSTDVGGQIAQNKQTVSGNANCCCFEDTPGSGNFILNYQNAFTFVKTTKSPGAGNANSAARTAQAEPLLRARRGQ